MTNNEVVSNVFKNQQYMTPEQLSIAHEFQNMIEAEYALCAGEMKKLIKRQHLKPPQQTQMKSNQ